MRIETKCQSIERYTPRSRFPSGKNKNEKNYSDAYAVVMNEHLYPLQSIPKVFRFQIMLFLSMMWSTVFCLTLGLGYDGANWWGTSPLR